MSDDHNGQTDAAQPQPAQPQPSQAQSPGPPPAHPSGMRLRAAAPSVTRLSRRVLVGLASVAIGGIAVALAIALWPHPPAPSKEEAHSGGNVLPEAVAGLPKDYSQVPQAPKLGPPLPGDLGKPMLNAGVAAPPIAAAQSPEQQRVAQERDAARTSHLFAVTSTGAAPAAQPASPPPTSAPLSQVSSDPTGTENMQDSKIAFANSGTEQQTVSPARIERPASPYIIQAGWVINAALAKGMKSDLPGDVHAQVTEAVFDSPTGRILLIPQGSMLEGKYSSQVSFGQTRMQMVWTRLVFPNGNSISLGHLTGADSDGYAGLEDGVDEHWGSIFKAAVLSTVLSVGAEAGTSNNENNLAQAIRSGASTSINQAGEQIVERNLNVQPTLTERFGLPVTVAVDQDLVLEPYDQKEAAR
jgi:type IV secretory pathway VirB10-like protein